MVCLYVCVCWCACVGLFFCVWVCLCVCKRERCLCGQEAVTARVWGLEYNLAVGPHFVLVQGQVSFVARCCVLWVSWLPKCSPVSSYHFIVRRYHIQPLMASRDLKLRSLGLHASVFYLESSLWLLVFLFSAAPNLSLVWHTGHQNVIVYVV